MMRMRLSALLPILMLAPSCRAFFGAEKGRDPIEDTSDTGTSDTGSLDGDGDGYSPLDGDCNDADPTVHIGADEECNGVDDDCDGEIDENPIDAGYVDADNDGYGAEPATVCGGVDVPGDCNDLDSQVYPGAPERCNLIDDDCDGDVDEYLAAAWYADGDGDGYGDSAETYDGCDPPVGWVADDTDCDDGRAEVNPDAVEVCDGLDNDCDGGVDEDVVPTWYADVDGDGYGDAATAQDSCDAPVGYVADDSDCDDANGRTNPGASEVCDSIDNDCDGTIDIGIGTPYYVDGDGDHYGGTTTILACEQFSGLSGLNTDCDDTDANIHPGAAEVCNGVDDDCDGSIDFGATITCHPDSDGDTYGDPASSTSACACAAGWVEDYGDCDDTDASSYPGAAEVYGDLLDQNCDGTPDDGC